MAFVSETAGALALNAVFVMNADKIRPIQAVPEIFAYQRIKRFSVNQKLLGQSIYEYENNRSEVHQGAI